MNLREHKGMRSYLNVLALSVFFSLSAFGGALARADQGTLIVLQGVEDSNAIYRTVIERLNQVSVVNNLSTRYARIDFLSYARSSVKTLLNRIEARSTLGPVDVMVLAPGSGESLHLRWGDLRRLDLQSHQPFRNLRLVYMNAGGSDSLVEGWLSSGAQLVIAQSTDRNVSGLFFPQFIRGLSAGKSAVTAAREAHRWTVHSFSKLRDFFRDSPKVTGPDLPRIQGQDFDYDGGASSRVTEWLDVSSLRASVSSPFFVHPQFERFSLQILSSALPQVSLDPDRVPSPAVMLQQAGSTAWEEISDIFHIASPFGASEDDDAIWIDGEAVRYFIEPLRTWTGVGFATIIDNLEGARLVRSPTDLKISIFFKKALQISLLEPGVRNKIGQAYRLDIPQELRATVRANGDQLEIVGLDQSGHAASLNVRIPFLPNAVNLRSMKVNLASGAVRVEVGLFRNSFRIVAKAQFYTRRFEGVDLWALIRENLPFFVWPILLFALF